MSDHQFERAVTDWLEDGSDRTPERAMDAVLLAVKTTPQERVLRIPWRPIQMPVNRSVAVAAVALVVVVAAGGLVYLNNRAPAGVAGQPAKPSVTPTPAGASASPGASVVAPAGWAPFTSPVYGYSIAYPRSWEASPASRAWQPGDPMPSGWTCCTGDGGGIQATWDMFFSPNNEIGFGVSKMPAGDGVDVSTVRGLEDWAIATCRAMGETEDFGACDTVPARTEQMCLDAGGDTCRAAILVRSYAFFGDWATVPAGGAPDKVVVVALGLTPIHSSMSRHASEQVLKTVLATMGVTADTSPAPEPSPAG